MKEFDELVEIMQRLRGPGGCPWDREQSHATLAPHLIEEAYELLEVLETDKPQYFCEELGDVLLQVVFHAQLAAEREEFDIRDVAQRIVDKLYHRHPHVFGDVQVSGSEEVLYNWEQLKHAEYAEEPRQSVLDGIPRALPALQRAQKLQRRASKVGFDWDDADGPREKLTEEIAELDAALTAQDPEAIRHEIGDALASLVNLCRFVDIDAEGALREANRRFERRFRLVEKGAQAQGRDLSEMTLDEMDHLWDAAKAAEPHPLPPLLAGEGESEERGE
jgi:MazG family protein